jgi:hypothetical protein
MLVGRYKDLAISPVFSKKRDSSAAVIFTHSISLLTQFVSEMVAYEKNIYDTHWKNSKQDVGEL